MKTLSSKCWVALAMALLIGSAGQAQFLKKLGKKAQKAAERTVERRVERETTKKTDQTLDSILEPGKKQPQPDIDTPNPSDNDGPETTVSDGSKPSDVVSSGSETLEVYSKFDFVPGNKLLFYDDYGNDFIGDFPSKWNTNGTGEVVTIGDSPDRWMEMIAGFNTYYVPNVPALPEEYTIEFDLLAIGLDSKTSSNTRLKILISDHPTFKRGKSHVLTSIPFTQYTPIGIRVRNQFNTAVGDVNNTIKVDIRDAVLNKPHISIAVNKNRYRLWVNEKKYVDIPKMLSENYKLPTLKFAMEYLKDGKERVFISNLKVAEGGIDLRRKLLSEGKVSTNGILFDKGSANIQPKSMGIIYQISQVLKQDPAIRLKIIGHTDSDGGEEANLILSKKRAEAVMNALTSIYGASPERLTAAGMGENQPIGDNNTVAGKAQNRRVEFIKQ